MQLTNGYIFYGFEALQKLAKLPMPAKTSFAVAKATRKLGEVYQDIREIRNSLIMKYGAETEPGKKKIEPGDPNWSEFTGCLRNSE